MSLRTRCANVQPNLQLLVFYKGNKGSDDESYLQYKYKPENFLFSCSEIVLNLTLHIPLRSDMLFRLLVPLFVEYFLEKYYGSIELIITKTECN
jgi:hypothetical protein